MALCISDTAGRYPSSEAITADFVYIRAKSLLVFPTFYDSRLTAFTAPLPVFMSLEK